MPRVEVVDGILTFHIPDLVYVGVKLVEAPIPNREAETYVRTGIASLCEPPWALGPHRAHLIVSQVGPLVERARVDQLAVFTRVVAAIAEASSAVGVYSGAALATNSTAFYVEMASTEPELPGLLMLWNGVALAGNADRVRVLSLGMAQLGLPNVQVTAPVARPGVLAEMFEILADFASHGSPLAMGDTFETKAGQRILVGYEPSPLGDGNPVWRIDL